DAPGRRWLHATLALIPRERPVVLLTHYQLDAAFFKDLEPYRIVASVSGHWHSSRLYPDGRVAHFNTPSFGFGGIDYSPRSYRVFTWSEGELAAETYPLLPADAGGRSAAAGRRFRAAAPGAALDGGPCGPGRLAPRAWPQRAGGGGRPVGRGGREVAGRGARGGAGGGARRPGAAGAPGMAAARGRAGAGQPPGGAPRDRGGAGRAPGAAGRCAHGRACGRSHR